MFSERLRARNTAEAIEEAFYGARSARLQLGTLSHLSGEMTQSLAPLRESLEKGAVFLSRRGNALLVAAVVIACAGVLNLARAWPRLRAL